MFHQAGPGKELLTAAYWVCHEWAVGTIWFGGLHAHRRASCGHPALRADRPAIGLAHAARPASPATSPPSRDLATHPG